MPNVQRTLVDVVTLATHLADPRWVILDCRAQLDDPAEGRRRYAAGHLPGARFASLDDDLSGPRTASSGRHPLPDPHRFATRAGELGIGEETQVVAYDDAGGAYAARLWWLLRWLGHEAVAVLDGGFQAWVAAGRSLSVDEPVVTSRHFVGSPDDSRWLDTADVLEIVRGASAALLVDARGAARYSGAQEPIDPVAGHIPGALNLPFTGNLDAGGRFLPRDTLRARFEAVLAGAPPERLVHYCGSGVTACHSQLAMEHAGLGGSRVYAGSWSEWIRERDRPIRTGPDR